MKKILINLACYIAAFMFFGLAITIVLVFVCDLSAPDAVETLLDWQFYLPALVFFPSLMCFIGFVLLLMPIQRNIISKLIKFFGYSASFSSFALTIFQFPIWVKGYIFLPRTMSFILFTLLPCGIGFGMYKLTSIIINKAMKANK